ncbi:MAG: hypothetical protein R2941_24455 [Desulfobacterales bacterium]
MSNQIRSNENLPVSQDQIVSNMVLHGDLSRLTPVQKVQYYNAICERIGLDPLTQPFKLLRLSGKEIMYLDRSGAQQLNKLYDVSHRIVAREIVHDCYVVTSQAFLPTGRQTESIGAVSIINLKGDQLCNAFMKAETKAKRRSTLDLLGLGMLDESEVETIPNAQSADPYLVSEYEPSPQERKPTLTPKQKSFIDNLIKSSVFTEEEREKTNAFLADPETNSKKASKMIDRLQELIRDRKQERELTEEKTLACKKCGAEIISSVRMARSAVSCGGKGWCSYKDLDSQTVTWLCPECQKPEPEPEPEGTPEELRRKAEAIREFAQRAEGQAYYKEMAEAKRLFAIADKREREQLESEPIN